MIVPYEIPLPFDANNEPLSFNSFVTGVDVNGRIVAGIVRGYGPPAGYYDGEPVFVHEGVRGPSSSFVLVHICGETYAECHANKLMKQFSMGPSPYEVGLVLDDTTGQFTPV